MRAELCRHSLPFALSFFAFVAFSRPLAYLLARGDTLTEPVSRSLLPVTHLFAYVLVLRLSAVNGLSLCCPLLFHQAMMARVRVRKWNACVRRGASRDCASNIHNESERGRGKTGKESAR